MPTIKLSFLRVRERPVWYLETGKGPGRKKKISLGIIYLSVFMPEIVRYPRNQIGGKRTGKL